MSNYEITESEAVTLTTAWRTNHPNAKRAFLVDKQEIDEIFSNSAATGMRVYLGEDSSGIRLVMVGVNDEGEDILDPIYDHALPCPSSCDNNSVLNNGN